MSGEYLQIGEVYTGVDVGRLRLLRDMRPLEFSVEEQRSLVATHDALSRVSRDGRERADLQAHLELYLHAIGQRITVLRQQVSTVEALAATLRAYPDRTARPS